MPAAAARTLIDIVRLSTAYLAQHGSASARLDAELLVAHALGLRRIDLYLQFERAVDGAELVGIRERLRRRADAEPIAYIIGEREFFSRCFSVTPDVLVPRPETETLVQVVLDLASRDGDTMIADLGTGSGCVAISLALALQAARIIAVDVSAAALDVARSNARAQGVADRIDFRSGSWADALDAPVDVVVSNPPYVTHEELMGAPADVRGYEPRIALDGGADGLDSYRALVGSLPGKLNPGGVVALEADPRRIAAVGDLLVAALPKARTRVIDDLGRTPRVIVAEPAGPPSSA